MGLNAQEQFAQSDVSHNMQNGGGGEVVQLEAIVFQQPSEEQMDWKTDTS